MKHLYNTSFYLKIYTISIIDFQEYSFLTITLLKSNKYVHPFF